MQNKKKANWGSLARLLRFLWQDYKLSLSIAFVLIVVASLATVNLTASIQKFNTFFCECGTIIIVSFFRPPAMMLLKKYRIDSAVFFICFEIYRTMLFSVFLYPRVRDTFLTLFLLY